MPDHPGDFKACRADLAFDGTAVSDLRMETLPATPATPRSRLQLVGLIVGTVVAVLAVLPSFVMATMSVMVAASGSSPLIAAFMALAFGLPVVVTLGPILAWVAFALRRERLSWALLILPAVWAAAMFGLLFLASDRGG